MKNRQARVPDKEACAPFKHRLKTQKTGTAPDIKNSFVFKMKIAKHEVKMRFEVSFV